MKGIYLTEQGKKEIEAKIDELNRSIQDPVVRYFHSKCQIKIETYKEILSSATILPVEKSGV